MIVADRLRILPDQEPCVFLKVSLDETEHIDHFIREIDSDTGRGLKLKRTVSVRNLAVRRIDHRIHPRGRDYQISEARSLFDELQQRITQANVTGISPAEIVKVSVTLLVSKDQL